MSEDLQRTWRRPQPRKVTGLAADLVYRWANEDKISKYKDEGWIVLDPKSSYAEGVTIGYDDKEDASASKYTYRGQTLMICHKDLMANKRKEMEMLNKAAFAGNTLKEVVRDVSKIVKEEIILDDDTKEVIEKKS